METLFTEKIVTLKRVELSSATVGLRSDGIMQFNIRPAADYSVKDIIAANEAAARIGNGKAYPNLIYIENFYNADSESRHYLASEESNRYTLADAFVVESVAMKLIGNFYIKVNKPVRPTRIFSSGEEALDWLYTFL
jgi:hypothetical protein